MKILVTDDKEEERYLAETILKGSGYEVVTAINGAEALEKLRAEGFDMIISDVLMPVMDGFRLCQECKEDEKLKDIPFIFYTATYKDEGDEMLASKVGAYRYILKPIEPEEFIKLIQDVFRDLDKGKVGQKKLGVKKEKEVLRLYSERLIAKLENKMLELEYDITERKQMERKLLESEERYRSVIENAHDMIQSVTPDGRFIFVNPAWLQTLGYTEAELSDLNVFNIIHPESLAHCQKLFAKVMHGESLKNIQATFIAKDGSEVLVEGSAAPRYVGSDIVATQGIFHDITERRKMEEQLIVTDRLASIGELSSGVAHELNNPLTSVIGFSDLLLDRDLPNDLRQDLEIINREAKRTAGVVKNLLTFARKHETERSSVNINNIIEKVLELRAYEQKVNNVEVNTRFASDLPEIMADGFRLQQVFINIIINAEHFMIETHKRGTMTITTERAGDIIRVSFSDDGPGIAKENMGHVFDPFFTTKEVGKGTGLGLSISYGIITEHGGKIYAKSELDKGATFVIELPVTNADRAGAINENSRE